MFLKLPKMAIIFQNKFLLYGTRGGGANSSLHPLSEKRGCTCPPTPPLATGLLETPSYPDKYCTEVTN